jgi:DNA-binding response OmpR family regulator
MYLIYVIDDSEFDRSILKKYLETLSYEVMVFPDGNSAIQNFALALLDLVLLDLVMPEESGIEVLKKIRSLKNHLELPVIMATARSDADDVIRALRIGANDYVTKPVEFVILSHRIATHLQMADLCQRSIHTRQHQAIQAMVATYNHELNNPLTLAMLALDRIANLIPEEPSVARLQESLERITETVKKIKSLENNNRIELEKYSQASNLVKIK